MTGRPSLYTEELADEICTGIANGKSLIKICDEIGISYRTVDYWLADESKSEFLRSYMRARDAQADYIAEQTIDIADDETTPPESRRIRIDARKWYAGKLKPKKYGDKQIHTGPDGEAPATFTLNIDRRDKDD